MGILLLPRAQYLGNFGKSPTHIALGERHTLFQSPAKIWPHNRPTESFLRPSSPTHLRTCILPERRVSVCHTTHPDWTPPLRASGWTSSPPGTLERRRVFFRRCCSGASSLFWCPGSPRITLQNRFAYLSFQGIAVCSGPFLDCLALLVK